MVRVEKIGDSLYIGDSKVATITATSGTSLYHAFLEFIEEANRDNEVEHE